MIPTFIENNTIPYKFIISQHVKAIVQDLYKKGQQDQLPQQLKDYEQGHQYHREPCRVLKAKL